VIASVGPSHLGRARRERQLLRFALFCIDLVALLVAIAVVGVIRVAIDPLLPLPADWNDRHFMATLVMLPIMLMVLWAHGRYDLENSLVGPREYAQIAHAVGYGVLLTIGVSYFVGDQTLVSRSWLVLIWGLSIGFLAVGRFVARRAVHFLHRRGLLHTRVIIIGASAVGVALANQFREAKSEGIDVVGFIDEFLPLGHVLVGVPVIGRPVDLVRGIDPGIADEYILVPQAVPHERLEEISRHVVSGGGPIVRMAVSSMDLLTHGFVIAERSNIPLLTLRRAHLSSTDLLLKRAADVVLAVVGLIVLTPVVLLLVAWRAMAGHQALSTRWQICTSAGRGATLHLLEPVVTRWLPIRGAPALLAVLRGDLSLVGPRPRLWPAAQSHSPVPLTAVAPGLTGPWRLAGPNISLAEQALADLTYVRNYSIWEDLRILWHTGLRLLYPGPAEGSLGRWQLRTATESESDALPTPDSTMTMSRRSRSTESVGAASHTRRSHRDFGGG
jgi:lipopolysaccharide/colanic/teichoic acid biosynthesis glycosyltransferase